MHELLTTDEAADYLRLSERKLYELVAQSALPCTKITGRWLFPKAALDRWVASGLSGHVPRTAPPPIIGGSHDPLLEWALRESGSGLATLPEGSEAGLRRLVRDEVVAAAIHLHRRDGNDELTNIETVADLPGLYDAVVIAFCRREQGLLVSPGNPLQLTDIASVAVKRARVALRPDGAGAQLLLLALLSQAGLGVESLTLIKPRCSTGPDLAQAVHSGRADCGVATRAVALMHSLDFIPLIWERFDLVLRQRDYFLPALQALSGFLRSSSFAQRAIELEGYDVSFCGTVRQVN